MRIEINMVRVPVQSLRCLVTVELFKSPDRDGFLGVVEVCETGKEGPIRSSELRPDIVVFGVCIVPVADLQPEEALRAKPDGIA